MIARHVFGIGNIQAQESITYMHAFAFMLAAAWTLSLNEHVRVDIFYRDALPGTKAWVDLAGALLLLIPFCVLVIALSWGYVGRSWAVLEGSRETSGIQAVFLRKTVIPVFAAMLGLQGIAMAIRAAAVLRGRNEAS